VVFSAKGGVGKTTIAVNVGAGLAQMGRSTLLVDANLYFGDASVLLNVVSRRSLMDLADVYQVDAAAVGALLVSHESGLSLLSSPPEVERVEMLSPEVVIAAITAAATAFEQVVVDTHSSFDETNLQILDMADRILLVTTPEVGATFNTSRFLSLAETLGYREKITLVLNRSESGIKPEAVETNLGRPVEATVISAGRRAVSAANRGVPLVLEDPRKEERITRDLLHIAELIDGQRTNTATPAGARRWPFSRKAALTSVRST
jgi:pilus assembly protein CpaE